MSRLLITTVGTSLLTNRDDRPWSGWCRGKSLPEADVVKKWLEKADLVVASAETNTLRGVGVGASDQVILLHSDTPEGSFCSSRLCEFLSDVVKCRSSKERPLKALSYHHASFAQKGLKTLVSESIKAIREAQSHNLQPLFCATGGFKAEIAFLNLLGALLDVEVYYIHDQFREIVRLPRLPLTWDAAWVIQHQDFFDWIDEEQRDSVDVESWLNGRPELRSLVEDDADGCTYLNAAGNLLYQASKEQQSRQPRAIWPPAVARTPQDKNGISSISHHRPRGWEKFVERLCRIDCVSRVTYDEVAYGGSTIKPIDSSTGTIAVRFGSEGNFLPLRIETSAHGEAQTELVLEYLRHRVV